MKKIILVLFALCLFALPVMAQTIDDPAVTTWDELVDSFLEKGYEGTFYNFTNLGFSILIPSGFTDIEITEALEEKGIVGYFEGEEDESNLILVIIRDLGVETLGEVAEMAVENLDAQFAGYYKINGFDAIIFADEINDEVVCVIPTNLEGTFIQVSVQPISDELMNAYSGYIFGSLQPFAE